MLYLLLALLLGVMSIPDKEFDFQAPVQKKELKDNERTYSWSVPSTDRYQWSHNYGYCGEVSLVMASMRYGAYFSQYDIRDIAVLDPIRPQSGGHWYNIGVNDQLTSSKVHLLSNEFADTREEKRDATTEDYISWMKSLIRKGNMVTICVYMNHYLFYHNNDTNAGYTEYDHIVTLTGYQSNYDDDLYHDDDIITMADHGLWSPRYDPVYYFSYVAKDWIGGRVEANDPNGPIYTLPKRTIENKEKNITAIRNYGIAQTGIIDLNNECFPITVATDKNYEFPQIGRLSEVRPEAMALELTVTVSELDASQTYVLYRYDDEEKVPNSNFNSYANQAFSRIFLNSKNIDAASGTFTMKESIMSNQKVVYRCVLAAPV